MNKKVVRSMHIRGAKNGWTLEYLFDMYNESGGFVRYNEEERYICTTSEQLVEKITDVLFPELEEKLEALPPEVRQHLIERDANALSRWQKEANCK